MSSMPSILIAFVLLLFAWPLSRLVASPAFRRGNPRLHAASAVLLVGYVAAIASTLVWSRQVLLYMALAVSASWVAAAFRGGLLRKRPGGLPPGPRSLFQVDQWLDDRFFLRMAAKYGPLFRIGLLKPTICIVGLDRGLDLLRRGGSSLRGAEMPYNRFIPKGFLRYMEPATHTEYRKVLTTVVSRRAVRASELDSIQIVCDGLATMHERSLRSRHGASPEPFVEGIVFAVFSRVFFGVMPATPAFVRFQELFPQIDTRPKDSSASTAPDALADLMEFSRTLIENRSPSAVNQVSAPTCFLDEVAGLGAGSDSTLLANLIYAMETSWHDVTELLTWSWKLLSDHPAWVVQLRTAGMASDDRLREGSLADRVILETLRLQQSEFLHRHVVEDLTCEGHRIPSGSLLKVCVRESHQDERIFDHPEAFDPDRFLPRIPVRSEYCPFGPPEHACLGEHLTRATGQIFVRELAVGFDWQVMSDGPPEHPHGRHWRPSSRFRVRLSPHTR